VTTTDNAELLPCPFCRTPEKVFENLRDNDEGEIEKCWTVIHECTVLCSTIIAHGNTEEQCAIRWNTRATPAEPDAELVERVAEAIYLMKPHQLTHGQMDTVRRVLASLPNTTPLNGGIRQRAGASAPDTGNSTSRESLPNNCERGASLPTHEAVQMGEDEAVRAMWSVDFGHKLMECIEDSKRNVDSSDLVREAAFQALSVVANITKKG